MRSFISSQSRLYALPLHHRCLSNIAPPCTNTAIQTFYDQYVNAFVSGDMKTVSTEFYKAPVTVCMSMHGETLMRDTFETPLDVEKALRLQMDGLLTRGYAGKSDMQPITITEMTDVAQLIQTEGIRYHTSGEILEKIIASYVIESDVVDAVESKKESEVREEMVYHCHLWRNNPIDGH